MHQIKPTRNNMLPPDPVFTMKSDMGYIHHLNFFQGRTSQLLAATEKGLVYFWDLNTHRASCKRQMGESIQAIHSYNDRIITQEKSGIIKLWSVEDSELINSYEYCGGYCKSITIDDILVVPQENSLDLVDKKTLKKTKRLVSNRKSPGHVMALEPVKLENNIYILAGFESGEVILWDIVTEKICGYSRLQEQLTTLTFDSVIGRGVCGGASNKMQVFTIDKSFNISLKCEVTLVNEGCSVVRIRPDRKVLVQGGWDGRIRIFSWKTLRTLAVLTEHKGTISDVQFSPDKVDYWESDIMAVSGSDGAISLWDLYNH